MNQQDIELALSHSTDCLRLAAQLFNTYGSPEVAAFLTEQADKNVQLLLPWVTRWRPAR